MNGTILQFFHWYHPGKVWNEFIDKAEYLKDLGFTAVWLPPAVKCASGTQGRGYDVYDLYDLGEFDQKGGISTRYGTKEEYLKAIEKAHEFGLKVYADIVLNHRMGGDEKEILKVHQVNEEDRNEIIKEPFEAEALTKFTFPGRNGKYSDFIWDSQCFSGIDKVKTSDEEQEGIFKIHNEYGTGWNENVSQQFGNYDYLMGADVDFRNPFVVEELKRWIKWYIETTNVDGLRMDALKHISTEFLREWIDFIKSDIDENFFIVGEFWKDELEKLKVFSEKMNHRICLFDVPLHFNFFKASQEGQNYNLSEILKGTFLEGKPECSVSFVGNHDTQQLQALESAVENWFRPLAYAIILLTENTYPCVFYPDIFGAEYVDKNADGEDEKIVMPKVEILPRLIKARQELAYGEQINYFDHPNCIAWIRKGDDNHEGCVVIISNSEESYKEMNLGKENAFAKFEDFLGFRTEIIELDDNGVGTFWVNPESVSVWRKLQNQ